MRDISAANLEAFTGRLGTMRPKLHRYCARMTGSFVDGEDVVQDAMIKALEAFPGEAEIANVEAWVFRIAHNCALDLLRRRSRQEAWVVEAPSEDIADPQADTEHRVATAASLRAFMGLPAVQRAAVILMDVLGYSLQEIAAVLEITVPAVKAALHRGRAQLRQSAAEDSPAGPAMSATDLRQLTAYVERFNAHDFDAIRALLAEDVRLDLVGRAQSLGREKVGRYFTNYDGRDDWRLAVGVVDGRPGVLVYDAGRVAYFAMVEWAGGRIARIVDFRYARYVMDDAEAVPLIQSMPG